MFSQDYLPFLFEPHLEDSFPEACKQDIELDHNGVDEESVRQRRPGMPFDEGHEKSKPNQHHHIDILIHGVICLVELNIDVFLDPDKDGIESHDRNLESNQDNCEYLP